MRPDTVATRKPLAGGPGVSVPSCIPCIASMPTANAEVLMNTLGEEFDGILGCDYFSAYRRYMKKVRHPRADSCLAHLIRGCEVSDDAAGPAHEPQLRRSIAGGTEEKLFEGIPSTRATQQGGVSRPAERGARDTIVRLGLSAFPTRHGQNMAKQFRKHGDAYFTFVTTPGVEPTEDNLAERGDPLRGDRPAYHAKGTRSEQGRQWSERIWTGDRQLRPAGQVGVWLFA